MATEGYHETVSCGCGLWMGERCGWTGPRSETVIVEYMPRQYRDSHEAAGGTGSWPHDGSERVRVERSCAELCLADPNEHGWARIIEEVRA